MSKMGEEIKQGLREAIEDAKKHNLRRDYINIELVKNISKENLKATVKSIETTIWNKVFEVRL